MVGECRIHAAYSTLTGTAAAAVVLPARTSVTTSEHYLSYTYTYTYTTIDQLAAAVVLLSRTGSLFPRRFMHSGLH